MRPDAPGATIAGMRPPGDRHRGRDRGRDGGSRPPGRAGRARGGRRHHALGDALRPGRDPRLLDRRRGGRPRAREPVGRAHGRAGRRRRAGPAGARRRAREPRARARGRAGDRQPAGRRRGRADRRPDARAGHGQPGAVEPRRGGRREPGRACGPHTAEHGLRRGGRRATSASGRARPTHSSSTPPGGSCTGDGTRGRCRRPGPDGPRPRPRPARDHRQARARPRRPRPGRARQRIFELGAILLLSLTTLATAWSGYQAARWSGEQSQHYARASATRIKAQQQSTAAGQLRIDDLLYFNGWLDARAVGRRAARGHLPAPVPAGVRPRRSARGSRSGPSPTPTRSRGRCTCPSTAWRRRPARQGPRRAGRQLYLEGTRGQDQRRPLHPVDRSSSRRCCSSRGSRCACCGARCASSCSERRRCYCSRA